MTTTPLSVQVLATPAGPLTVISSPEDDVVRAAGFARVPCCGHGASAANRTTVRWPTRCGGTPTVTWARWTR